MFVAFSDPSFLRLLWGSARFPRSTPGFNVCRFKRRGRFRTHLGVPLAAARSTPGFNVCRFQRPVVFAIAPGVPLASLAPPQALMFVAFSDPSFLRLLLGFHSLHPRL